MLLPCLALRYSPSPSAFLPPPSSASGQRNTKKRLLYCAVLCCAVLCRNVRCRAVYPRSCPALPPLESLSSPAHLSRLLRVAPSRRLALYVTARQTPPEIIICMHVLRPVLYTSVNTECIRPFVHTLLLPESNRLLNGNGELLVERLERLVARQVETVETALVSCCRSCRRRGTYHVCDLGSWLGSPAFSMVKRLGPSLPCRSLNPLTGIRDVPVANCSRRDFCSASQLRMHFQKFWMTSSFSVYPR
jgi:hypothetical protein